MLTGPYRRSEQIIPAISAMAYSFAHAFEILKNAKTKNTAVAK